MPLSPGNPPHPYSDSAVDGDRVPALPHGETRSDASGRADGIPEDFARYLELVWPSLGSPGDQLHHAWISGRYAPGDLADADGDRSPPWPGRRVVGAETSVVQWAAWRFCPEAVMSSCAGPVQMRRL